MPDVNAAGHTGREGKGSGKEHGTKLILAYTVYRLVECEKWRMGELAIILF